MRKILTLSAFVLFLASVLFFNTFGAQLRDFVSPTVEYVMAAYRSPNEEDNRAYPSFPREAVRTAEDGATYVWVIYPSEEYPEDAYTVKREEVTVVHDENGLVYVRFMGHDITGGIVVEMDEELRDGQRVNVKN